MSGEKKFSRRVMREKVLQILYAYQINGEGLTLISNSFLTEVPAGVDKEFAVKLVDSVVAHLKEIDALIRSRVNNWELDRIALIDRLLLRMGIAELMYFPDIPPKVSINEVIEIAKEYSTAKSGKFINGILDALLTHLKESDQLNKTGRGLIDTNLTKK